jgi:hypothetical protein
MKSMKANPCGRNKEKFQGGDYNTSSKEESV